MQIKFTKISQITLVSFFLGASFLFLKETTPRDWDFFIKEKENGSSSVKVIQELPNSQEAVTLKPVEIKKEVVQEVVKEEVAPEKKEPVFYDVPFTPQAPHGQWSDIRYQEGCEETSVLMTMLWIAGKKTITTEEADQKIAAIADYEIDNYNSFKDTSASSTIERIIEGYYGYAGVELKYDVEKEDVIKELQSGNLIIAPFNGRALGNPHYSGLGPERHMLVIVGYDYDAHEFITNDPGTKYGKNYRYDEDVLIKAMRDYPTGNHAPIVESRRAIIIVHKVVLTK